MRIERRCQGRAREDRDGEEEGEPGRSPDLGRGVSPERGREFREMSLLLLPPAPCGSAICQAGEYTTRDNGEVSQTLRTATERPSRLTNARPSPVRFRGTGRVLYAYKWRSRHTGTRARMISAPSGNGMIRDAAVSLRSRRRSLTNESGEYATFAYFCRVDDIFLIKSRNIRGIF